ncbi:MAG: hypothetical protein A2X34_01510 [Elusimicrobia bacterium GWC2_51_8]|nr:MAG: hypothetical protein A2X33_08625 [Elusimicrobia bacterium GWA2_51_34]OGR57668.1 MAG: hypothetical protein A2X34_01510 [Elusimicrobia bacterium GWC2_51_8]HAF95910.1 hypothetical protein [Elusimicrobiota bacterium]HCE98020.1 hypothetical protein [Elusimicrobiota bacterium]
MLTKGAVEDIIMLHLSRREPGGAEPVLKKVPKLGKKVFLSDWEIRRMFKPGSAQVTVPQNAIISPLSHDWLDYDGISIIRR